MTAMASNAGLNVLNTSFNTFFINITITFFVFNLYHTSKLTTSKAGCIDGPTTNKTDMGARLDSNHHRVSAST